VGSFFSGSVYFVNTRNGDYIMNTGNMQAAAKKRSFRRKQPGAKYYGQHVVDIKMACCSNMVRDKRKAMRLKCPQNPETSNNISDEETHANHVEANNSAMRRKCSAELTLRPMRCLQSV
jgi:hypothetical protein